MLILQEAADVGHLNAGNAAGTASFLPNDNLYLHSQEVQMKLLISFTLGIYLMRKHGLAEMALVSLGIFMVLCMIFH